ncbi:ribosome silencing factor [bacterium]
MQFMTRKVTKTGYQKYAKYTAQFFSDKKAGDVIILDVRGISDITDYFIFATCRSTTHVSALAVHIKNELKKQGLYAMQKQGVVKDSHWAVIDYIDMVIHLFTKDIREYYRLEDLWGDAKKVYWKGTVKHDKN